MIKFSHTIFYVKNVLQTIHFYESVFEIKLKFVHESKAYAELMTGDVTLAFSSEELGKMNLPSGFQKNSAHALPHACEIVFTTDNPEQLYQKAIKSGAISLSSPQEKPWGQVVAYVRDPNGILIEIAGEMP
jgi:uncharacterized glyoxalase superfamily protein PhnB